MLHDPLVKSLYDAICAIRLIDPHSHINPHAPTSKTLDDILGYHYYTELAHSAGMSQAPLQADVEPRERARALFEHLERLDNTVQYSWFLEIARAVLGFEGDRISASDCDPLWEKAEQVLAQPDHDENVLNLANVEQVFLTNDFDDPLEGFDTTRYVPCLRTDDLVFHLGKPETVQRLENATDVSVTGPGPLRDALGKLFEHFVRRGAKACAISLPPDFSPEPVTDARFGTALESMLRTGSTPSAEDAEACSNGVFWSLAELCRTHSLPFDLMIGVNRKVYRDGVFQGQDLFDQRTSLIQYAELFNAFPEVTFPISVLTSGQNQELASYAWIFPNVVTNGHWWYSNVPVYLESDTRGRAQAVPKSKQIGYYSDAYKLEFVLPKVSDVSACPREGPCE